MKKGLRRFLLALAVLIIASSTTRTVNAAEEEKPLGPGWLSLDCCIGPLDNAIANGKDSLQKASGLNFGGYLDTSYTWSSNHPRSPSAISLRYFDKDYNKIVFNNFHLFVEKPEKDWGVGFRVSGDFGRTGELLREATLWGKSLNKEPSAELREAYLTTTIPVGEGIGVKGGLFVTTLGTEILPNPGAYNDNISRSYLFNFGVPLRHLGMMFNYPVHKMVNVNFGVVTGWDNPRDNNHQPSFMGGVTVTPSDMIIFREQSYLRRRTTQWSAEALHYFQRFDGQTDRPAGAVSRIHLWPGGRRFARRHPRRQMAGPFRNRFVQLDGSLQHSSESGSVQRS